MRSSQPAKHLVKAFSGCSICQAKDRIQHALLYLRACLQASMTEICTSLQRETWAIELKRSKVTLVDQGHTQDIGPDAGTEHNFSEVVNQVATIRRLRDALVWAEGCDALRSYTVTTCHPTTSGARKSEESNDLILERGAQKAHFEVSDILRRGGGGKKGLCPVPDEPLPSIGTLGFRVQRYGMLQWGDLFTARQIEGIEDLDTIYEPFRLFRNAVFHAQPKYWSPKLFEIMKDPESALKIRKIHSALGKFFSD